MANAATQPADNWFMIGTASQLQIRYNLEIYDKGLAVMKFFLGGASVLGTVEDSKKICRF